VVVGLDLATSAGANLEAASQVAAARGSEGFAGLRLEAEAGLGWAASAEVAMATVASEAVERATAASEAAEKGWEEVDLGLVVTTAGVPEHGRLEQ
jgi:hypothetical protein